MEETRKMHWDTSFPLVSHNNSKETHSQSNSNIAIKRYCVRYTCVGLKLKIIWLSVFSVDKVFVSHENSLRNRLKDEKKLYAIKPLIKVNINKYLLLKYLSFWAKILVFVGVKTIFLFQINFRFENHIWILLRKQLHITE